jgi:hypothetical protein
MLGRALKKPVVAALAAVVLTPFVMSPAVAFAGNSPSAGDSQYSNPLIGSGGPQTNQVGSGSAGSGPSSTTAATSGSDLLLVAAVGAALVGTVIVVRRRVGGRDRTR